MDFPQLNALAKPERTLCIFKADAIYRGLTGKIISRFEEVGLKLIAARMLRPDRKRVSDHYNWGAEWVKNLGVKTLATYKQFGVDVKKTLGTDNPVVLGKAVRKKLIEYLLMGPAMVMVWEGIAAIEVARKIRGSTTPLTAAVGTVIGNLSHDSQLAAPLKGRSLRNLVHLSGNKIEAKKEIEIWFGKKPNFEKYDRADSAYF